MSFKNRIVFGDFQTPPGLAGQVAAYVHGLGARAASIVEPSCGQGELLAAATEAFPRASYLGLEINPVHARTCRRRVRDRLGRVVIGDFFKTDWDDLLADLAEPLLVVGNPPWVTTAGLSAVRGTNAPARTNPGLRGVDAITGRANFDISEWMLRHLIVRIDERDATLAMLCKTAVARKLLAHMWKRERGPASCRLVRIDANQHFAASVDACLLVCRFPFLAGASTCQVYESFEATTAESIIAYRDGELIADLTCYDQTKHLLGDGARWRSGVKHDCSAVVELHRDYGDRYRNGLGESIELEPDYLFPMLKSSELARGAAPRRFMLVTQTHPSQTTESIAERAPRTWQYLRSHRERFARRASSIYANRDAFAMFGIGDYTFSPWKVAVSGFYKHIVFRAIGPWDSRPVVFDDTCYVLACDDRAQAERRARALNSDQGRAFFRAHVFADSKRPVTARLLGRLDVDRLG